MGPQETMTDRLNPDWWEILHGSRFRCTHCGRCCERPGHVYFNREEVGPIARYLGIPVRRFLSKFAKKTNGERGAKATAGISRIV